MHCIYIGVLVLNLLVNNFFHYAQYHPCRLFIMQTDLSTNIRMGCWFCNGGIPTASWGPGSTSGWSILLYGANFSSDVSHSWLIYMLVWCLSCSWWKSWKLKLMRRKMPMMDIAIAWCKILTHPGKFLLDTFAFCSVENNIKIYFCRCGWAIKYPLFQFFSPRIKS